MAQPVSPVMIHIPRSGRSPQRAAGKMTDTLLKRFVLVENPNGMSGMIGGKQQQASSSNQCMALETNLIFFQAHGPKTMKSLSHKKLWWRQNWTFSRHTASRYDLYKLIQFNASTRTMYLEEWSSIDAHLFALWLSSISIYQGIYQAICQGYLPRYLPRYFIYPDSAPPRNQATGWVGTAARELCKSYRTTWELPVEQPPPDLTMAVMTERGFETGDSWVVSLSYKQDKKNDVSEMQKLKYSIMFISICNCLKQTVKFHPSPRNPPINLDATHLA